MADAVKRSGFSLLTLLTVWFIGTAGGAAYGVFSREAHSRARTADLVASYQQCAQDYARTAKEYLEFTVKMNSELTEINAGLARLRR